MIDVAVPIVSVIVFEDRAQITRQGAVPREGTRSITIDGVSPLAVERTIETVAPAGSTVTQVRLRRWLDTETTDRVTDDPDLRAASEDALVATTSCRRRVDQLESEVASLQTLRDLTIEELAVAANEAPLDGEHADQQLATIRAHEQRTRERLTEALAEARAARRTYDDLRVRVDAAHAVGSVWRAALDVDLEPADPDAPGSDAMLTVRYVVPNAAWRPAHVATRTVDGAAVSVRSEAVVWQATEERWEDVHLVLSTARTSAATEPPAVEDDVLRLVESGRDIEIEWREADDALGTTPVFAELPSVDDGGEPRRLAAEGRVTIAADGLPNRVPVGSFSAPATSDLVCRPERAAAVHRRTRQVNEQAAPLLAGPVLLVEHGGVIGWTTTPYVGPHERFELGWGPEVALVVDRRVESRDDAGITGASATDHRVRVQLHNNGTTAQVIEVVERVPVSEIDRVQIDVAEVQPPVRPDADGLVHWNITVEPRGAATLTVAYSVRRHRSVTS